MSCKEGLSYTTTNTLRIQKNIYSESRVGHTFCRNVNQMTRKIIYKTKPEANHPPALINHKYLSMLKINGQQGCTSKSPVFYS